MRNKACCAEAAGFRYKEPNDDALRKQLLQGCLSVPAQVPPYLRSLTLSLRTQERIMSRRA